MKQQAMNILKEFWFVLLVGCIFISFAIYFAWDTNKDKIPAKSADGKDVIFSTDGYNYFADDYYTDTFNSTVDGTKQGVSSLYTIFQNTVLEQAIKTTDEMKDNAEATAEQYRAYYTETYGDSADQIIESQLIQSGYSGLEDFELLFINQAKYMQLVYDYVMNDEELSKQFTETEQPRFVSQIFVSAADVNELTDAEIQKMNDVDQAIAEKSEFAKIAQLYSDDETASVGGSLGLVLRSTGLHEAVLTEAYALSKGDISSEWIKTDTGFYKLYVEETDLDKILEGETVVNDIAQAAVSMNENIFNEALWDAAKKLDVNIEDAQLQEELLTFMNITEEEDTE